MTDEPVDRPSPIDVRHLRSCGLNTVTERIAVMTQFAKVIRGSEGGPYACPCCGFLTLPSRGGYDICPVCFWEDDGQDDPAADEVWSCG